MGLGQAVRLPRSFLHYAWSVWRNARPAARRRGTSVFRIVREQLALKARNELGPAEYFFYGLDDPAMPWERKLTYIGQSRLRKHWYVFTPPKYQYCIDNKLIFTHLFRSLGLPLAQLYGVYDPLWGRAADGAPLRSAEDLGRWMERSGVREAVFKPMESAESQMIVVMKGRKPGSAPVFISTSGEEYTPRRIVEHFSDPALLRDAYPGSPDPPKTVVIQERLHQHPALRAFSEETLCCVRVTTLTTLDGRVEILLTVMKLQPEPSGVDAPRCGGLQVFVDSDTGVLGTGRDKHEGEAKRTCLPGTDTRFTGFALPMWDEVREVAKSAAAAFPWAHTVGWVIGLTDKGPVIVEGNVTWGDFEIQILRGLNQGAYKEVVEQLQARGHGAS